MSAAAHEMPTTIGIAGGTASGTSTLASKLADYLGSSGYTAVTVSLDSFYRPMHEQDEDTQEAVNWDHPKTLDWGWALMAVERLAEGKPTGVPEYSFETAQRRRTYSVGGDHDYVIIEGLWTLFSILRDHYDATLYVDAPPWVRLCRRVRRDTEERGKGCIETVNQFERECQPMHNRHVAWQEDYAPTVNSGWRTPDDMLERAIHLLSERSEVLA